MRHSCPIALFFILGWQPCLSQNWPQWRGPVRDGSAPAFTAPANWPEEPRLIWKVAVGNGYASPVISEGRVFMLSGEGDTERVSCYEVSTGKQLWEHRYPIAFKMNQYALKFGKGPFATPLVAGKRVFTVGITGKLHCFDTATGKILWRDAFEGTLTDDRHYFCGNSVSPLVVGKKLIVSVGNETGGRMTAYDQASGKRIWSWDKEVPGYASPILAEFGGVRQIVTLTQTRLVGIDPEGGHLLWEVPFESKWRENIVTPIQFEQSVIISGVDRATLAFDIVRESGGWKAKPRWRNEEVVMYLSSPVLIGEHLFGLSKARKGQFFCLNVRGGELLWSSPGREGQNATLVHADRYLLWLTNEAKLVVTSQADQSYQPLRQYALAASETWAHPAVFGSRILVKDRQNLMLWDLSPKAP